MKIATQPNLSFYVTKGIALEDLHPQKPLNIMLFKQDKCILLCSASCLLIDGSTGKVQKTYSFGNINVDRQIYPYMEGFCFSAEDDTFQVDENLQSIKCKKGIAQVEGMRDSFCLLGHTQSPVTAPIFQHLAWFRLHHRFEGKSSVQKVIECSRGSILFLDLLTRNIVKRSLPFSDQIQSLCCVGKNQIICHSYQNKCGHLRRVVFEGSATKVARKLRNTPKNLQYVTFHKFNTLAKQILFSTLESLYVYDYQKERVVGQFGHRVRQKYYKQASEDLKNIVQIEGEKIIYHRLTNKKRLAMHLFKHSGMEDAYGGCTLMRMIVSVSDEEEMR